MSGTFGVDASSFTPPMYTSDGSEGATRQFMAQKKMFIDKNSTEIPTHLLLNGGKVRVPSGGSETEEDIAQEFFERMSHDYRNGTMVPIVAVRTVVFRMYADFDLKIPCSELSTYALRKMTIAINHQAQRFFPEGHPPLTCIVCTKSEQPKGPIESSVTSQSMAAAIGIPVALYKHGIHFHWPDVYVKQEDALYMRESMIAALERIDWTEHVGTCIVDWDTVFDASVYGSSSDRSVSGSLRMTGAPKASICSSCKNDKHKKIGCELCLGRGYIIDPVHYRLFEAFSGEVVDQEKTSRLKANVYKLFMETNIRSSDPDRSTISVGWRLYPGCPPLNIKDGRGRKRKCADAEGMERKFTRNPEVKDVEKERVIRKYFVQLSPYYINSSFRIMYEEKKIPLKLKSPQISTIVSYKCPLRGDNSRFCMNLKTNDGFHKSQNVWIEIVPKNLSKNEYVARMRCFCKCNTIEGRRQLCSNFKSKEIMLDSDDVSVLFHKSTNAKQDVDRAIAEYFA